MEVEGFRKPSKSASEHMASEQCKRVKIPHSKTRISSSLLPSLL